MSDIPDADELSIPSSIESDCVPVDELQELLETIRSMQHERQEDATEATSAQSTKYNQGGAYAYCISANTLESLIEEHE